MPGTPLGRQPAKGATQYSKGQQVAMLTRAASCLRHTGAPRVHRAVLCRMRPRGYILPDSKESGRPGMNKLGARNQIKGRVVV